MENYVKSISKNLPNNIILLRAGSDKKCPVDYDNWPMKEWTSRTKSDQYDPNWSNYAMLTGSKSGIWVFDIDNKDNNVSDMFDWFYEHDFDPEEDAFTVKTPSGGYHIYFKHDVRVESYKIYNKNNDIQSNGHCVIFIGSEYPKGSYELINDVEITFAPEFIIEAITKSNICSSITKDIELSESDGITHDTQSIRSDDIHDIINNAEEHNKKSRIIELLKLLNRDRCVNYDEWLKIGIIIKNELGDDGFDLFNEFSKQDPDAYNSFDKTTRLSGETLLRHKWNGFKKDGTLLIGSLVHRAKQDSPTFFEEQKERKKKDNESFKDFVNKCFKEQVNEFEKTHCKIVNNGMYIRHINNKIDVLSKTKMSDSYCHIPSSLSEKTRFINDWFKYPDIRRYDTMDIYPDKHNCPSNCFNLWTDFYCDTINEYTEKLKERDLILNHIKILCDNDEEVYSYVIGWIANMLQYPYRKSTMITFYAQQGAGKGCLLKLLSNIIGEDKYYSTACPDRDIWGNFNGLMLGKSLINLDEMEKKLALEADGKIKNMITETVIPINDKGISQIKVKSYHRFIITTNNLETIKISKDDRRNVLIQSSSELIGNESYFNHMWKIIEDPNVIKTMAVYFKSLTVPEIYLNAKRPMTELKRDLIDMCKNKYDMWLDHYALGKSGTIEIRTSICYDDFKKFAENNHMAINEVNIIKFGKYLQQNKNVKKGQHTKYGSQVIIDIDAINKEQGIEPELQEGGEDAFKELCID